MITYGIEHDYVETATGFADPPKQRRPIMLASDHYACEPTFAMFTARSWLAVHDEAFTGLVHGGECSTCKRRALLRVPQHLVVAIRLLRAGC